MPRPVSITPPIARSSAGPIQRLRDLSLRASLKLLSGSYSANKADRLINLRLAPLSWMLLAGSLLAYQHGEEKAKGLKGNSSQAFKTARDGMVNYVMVHFTQGFYPIWAIYRTITAASRQHDALTKLQAVIQSLATLGLGYLGVTLGTAWSEATARWEESSLLTMLEKNDKIKAWIDTHPSFASPTPGTASEAADMMRHARTRLQELQNAILDKKPDVEIDQLRNELSSLRGKLLSTLGKEPVQALVKNEAELGKFYRVLQNIEQPYVKLARTFNPIFSSIIMMTLVGIPLVRTINLWVQKRFPTLQGKQFHWMQPIPPTEPAMHAPAASHSSGDSYVQSLVMNPTGVSSGH